jgi:hypothetical protein
LRLLAHIGIVITTKLTIICEVLLSDGGAGMLVVTKPFRCQGVLSFMFATGALMCAARGQGTGVLLYELSGPNGYPNVNPQRAAGGWSVGYAEKLGGSNPQAMLWTSSGSVNLTPTGLGFSIAYGEGTSGAQQVGFAGATAVQDQAILWTGSAASAINLRPSGFVSSAAYFTNGSQQVGQGSISGAVGDFHALLWNGTAASAVDLNPSGLGITQSEAWGTDGIEQVGDGQGNATGSQKHALLWSGSADSAVDLHPSQLQMISSSALGVGGTQQVGDGYTIGGNIHALLWTGTAGSAVDLNPSGYDGSFADATNGSRQVGWGFLGSNPLIDDEALVWGGSAGVAVNLQGLLPASETWVNSKAYSMDASGNIFGVAEGTGSNGGTNWYAVEWSNVTLPEPASVGFICLCGSALLLGRRRTVR